MTELQESGSQSDETELPFELLQERYEMIEAIGAGGMGSVYHAHDPILVRDVAIKLLAWDIAPTQEQVQRMQREAQALARLKHPNILSIWDFVMDDQNRPFLIMEYIQGKGLDSILKNDGPLWQYNAAAIAVQVCEGMSRAHAEGLLHRDLKPSNILLENSESEMHVKIIDLGLAKFVEGDQALTKKGIAMGSPPYMSPEQSRGQALEESSDVYSFGCVLFEMLTGVPPFMGSTAVEIMTKHTTDPAPKLSDVAPNKRFSESLENVVAKCLEKEPANRYQSMDDLKDELLELLSGSELIEEDSIEPTDSEDEKQPESNKPLVILLGTLVICCIGMIALWFQYLQPTEDPSQHKLTTLDISNKPFAEKVYEDGFSPYGRGPHKGFDTLKIWSETGLEDAAKKHEKGFHSIYFKGNEISGKGFAFFKNEPLEYVFAAKGMLTDEGARELSELKSIRMLDVMETDKLSEKAFIEMISALPKLEQLTFGSKTTTIESFKAVARHPKLLSVAVRTKHNPLPKGFGTELIKSKTIESLVLDDCFNLGENDLKELLPSRRLRQFAIKSQKVNLAMAQLIAQMSSKQHWFEECTLAPKVLTELAKKKGVELQIDSKTVADLGEIKELVTKGVLTQGK